MNWVASPNYCHYNTHIWGLLQTQFSSGSPEEATTGKFSVLINFLSDFLMLRLDAKFKIIQIAPRATFNTPEGQNENRFVHFFFAKSKSNMIAQT